MNLLKCHGCPSLIKISGASLGLLIVASSLSGADFAVRTPGAQFAFQINGVNAPTLYLIRGRTYTFDVQTTVGFHPFHIQSLGVSPNDITTGTMTYNVPTTAANYYYNCTFHGDSMRGEIRTLVPADFIVTTPNDQFAFQINGTNSPTLTLVRGKTYTFSVATSIGFHPFHIESPGVDVNDIDDGVITYTVPTNAANYFYNCTIHGDTMRGEITTVAPPPPPPTFSIVGFTVGADLTVLSTGSNTWTFNPEYSTNLSTTNWYALTVKSNRFFNGTNEAICGKPPGNAVFIRVRAQVN